MNKIFRDDTNKKLCNQGTKERRDNFIEQVTEIYQNISHSDSQNHFHQTTTGITPGNYYGSLQAAVTHEISQGKFDTCRDGMEIVNKVAKDKTLLSNWEK